MRTGILFVALLIGAAPALAQQDGGPVGAAIPKVDGKNLKHVFTVTGVTGYGDLHTAFFCTSLEKSKLITVAIEVWDYNAVLLNDVTTGNGVHDLAAGETGTFETNLDGDDIVGINDDVVIDLDTNADHGSARILSTSTKLACTAMVVEKVGDPPASMASLHVFAKKKQKGD
jgi:hypothetical protein